MDTWLLLEDVQNGAERNRLLHILKSRGMAHSNQIREFLLANHGAELRDVYVGSSGVLLAGSARDALEAYEKAQVPFLVLLATAARGIGFDGPCCRKASAEVSH